MPACRATFSKISPAAPLAASKPRDAASRARFLAASLAPQQDCPLGRCEEARLRSNLPGAIPPLRRGAGSARWFQIAFCRHGRLPQKLVLRRSLAVSNAASRVETKALLRRVAPSDAIPRMRSLAAPARSDNAILEIATLGADGISQSGCTISHRAHSGRSASNPQTPRNPAADRPRSTTFLFPCQSHRSRHHVQPQQTRRLGQKGHGLADELRRRGRTPRRRPFGSLIGRSWSQQKIARRRPATPVLEWRARALGVDKQCWRPQQPPALDCGGRQRSRPLPVARRGTEHNPRPRL